ncbi:MAG: hypothetical protein IPN33_25155 [Saprospiraceae bacterium]|nr:hypothetical protein [Saprospiraceae bacterium]
MNKSCIITLLCLLSGLSLGAQAPSGNSLFGSLRARQIGPAVTSGRISTLAVVPDQTETVYVGTAGGGVWKSVSGGTTVRPVFDDHTQSIGKIAIDPQKPDVVWVGTGEPWVRNSVAEGNGIYKTSNGGTNWEHKGLAETGHISDIIIHPTNSDVLYVGAQGHLWNANAERGVYKTTDGGKTWEKVLYIDENTGCADLSIDPQNPDIIYAAMWSYRRSPWFFDSGFTGKSGLYKSTDGGKTWNTIHNGLPNEMLGRMAVAVAPSNGNVIYLSVECKSKDLKGLYLSTDQGASWKKVSSDFNTTVRPFYFANMVVDPKNDSIVMKCGLNAIISEDRGERFRGVDGSVHSDIHDIWINPNNTKHLLLATDGGVYESLDRGRSFRMWMNLPVGQLYHVSVDNETPYNVYCGLQDNGSWYAPPAKPVALPTATGSRVSAATDFTLSATRPTKTLSSANTRAAISCAIAKLPGAPKRSGLSPKRAKTNTASTGILPYISVPATPTACTLRHNTCLCRKIWGIPGRASRPTLPPTTPKNRNKAKAEV